MPRTRYVITDSDCVHAFLYLSGRLRNYEIDFPDTVDSLLAESDFHDAGRASGIRRRTAGLNAWCEQYLSSPDWQRLKSAIRKRRERAEHFDEQKSITVSARAHNLLSRIAQRDDVTFTEVLEHYLTKALKSNRGRPSRSRRPR